MLRARDGVREIEAQLTPYVERLSQRLHLDSVIVTGSRATNTHLRKSDIDLVVVSPDFEGMKRLDRIDLLLEPWEGDYALEPLGFTRAEIEHAHGQYLWDALADGRVVRDNGTWASARGLFEARLAAGELKRSGRGWRQAVP